MIDRAYAYKRIHDFFPQSKESDIIFNEEGSVNLIAFLNNERVFKFPREEWGEIYLKREVILSKKIARISSVNVPEFDIVENDFGSYKMIHGTDLSSESIKRLPVAEQKNLAWELALFLKSINELKIDGPWFSDSYRSKEDWIKLYEDVQTFILPIVPNQYTRSKINYIFAPLINDELDFNSDLCVINGDINPYHIKFDKFKNKITGIIDLGTIGLGDPAYDLSVLMYNYGENFISMMSEVYPKLKYLIKRARFMRNTMEMQWLLNGLKLNEKSWFTLVLNKTFDDIL